MDQALASVYLSGTEDVVQVHDFLQPLYALLRSFFLRSTLTLLLDLVFICKVALYVIHNSWLFAIHNLWHANEIWRCVLLE